MHKFDPLSPRHKLSKRKKQIVRCDNYLFFLQFQVRNFWLIQFGNGAQLNYRIYLNLVKIKRKKREKYKVLQQLGGTTDINICQLTHKRCYYEQTWQHTETAAC